jgi:2-polyprenyl-3-methyl-5-hydroxy-6-metoxy-1,4-benzoquinol methylase
MPSIFSPLYPNQNATIVKTIRASKIIKGYNRFLKLDVARFFKNTTDIYIAKCPTSGYQFYYPLNVAGDGQFYADLSSHSWYYMDWKWENEEALNHITSSSRVLDVGCAKGDFLERIITTTGCTAKGIELNEDAIAICKKKELDVAFETVQQHCETHKETYDVVCSFQVLEHISDPLDFLAAKINCLKPGGKLIIGVPNNDSFIKHDPLGLLNLPPHHMGLWTPGALQHLCELFPLKEIAIKTEPFQSHHKSYFIRIHLSQKFKSPIIAALLMKTGLYNLFISRKKLEQTLATSPGHSVLAVFEKTK